MFRLMAQGQAVQLTSPMASVKKLARLAFIAQQFGYEYADVRQGAGRNNALTMLIVPDPGPQAQARAAQNWAQYPKAGDGVSLPPVVPDALELLKARINFVSRQAEYTPPVIYSREQRSRLVFMVEARPLPADAARLKPGQPVDVALE